MEKIKQITLFAILLFTSLALLGCTECSTDGDCVGQQGNTCIDGFCEYMEPPPIPEGFPEEYIQRADEYMISKFGSGLFDESVEFSKAYVMNFSIWGGCTAAVNPIGDGKKYVVEYNFNQSKYVQVPLENESEFYSGGEPTYKVRVVFNHKGNVDCTSKVMDCASHPEFCPPYNISRYGNAVETFNEKCNFEFTDVYFDIYDYYNMLGYVNQSESRFMWNFKGVSCGERHCTTYGHVYLDPHSGEIIDEFYGVCDSS